MKVLSSHFIELTQDACLKAFWRKKALSGFLAQHHLEKASTSWIEGETKYDFLARLFPKLAKAKNGHEVIIKMAVSLTEMEHFPDLERHEDTKIKIRDAKEAIQRLREQVKKLNQEVANEKEITRRRQEAEENRQQAIKSIRSLDKLASDLNNLVPKLGTQEGGYAFEDWFYELVAFFEIPCRPKYTDSHGRQIDGSFTIDGTTYLIETKFPKEQTGSQDIDIFLSKINRKADNTMGIMVSMAGFNSNAINTASHDRTPLLLMDHSHLYGLVLNGLLTLPELIQRIARHAAQTGESYLAVNDF